MSTTTIGNRLRANFQSFTTRRKPRPATDKVIATLKAHVLAAQQALQAGESAQVQTELQAVWTQLMKLQDHLD